MATVETAAVCKEFASGLAASEESESGNGWPYHSLLAQISATPSMTPEQVGTLLCESYLHNNMIQGTDENATFSFTDLTKLDGLTDAPYRPARTKQARANRNRLWSHYLFIHVRITPMRGFLAFAGREPLFSL